MFYWFILEVVMGIIVFHHLLVHLPNWDVFFKTLPFVCAHLMVATLPTAPEGSTARSQAKRSTAHAQSIFHPVGMVRTAAERVLMRRTPSFYRIFVEQMSGLRRVCEDFFFFTLQVIGLPSSSSSSPPAALWWEEGEGDTLRRREWGWMQPYQ